MRKNTKPSKVVVVSEYSLSEVTVSQFTAALNQNIHPLFTYTETAAGVLIQHLYCVLMCVLADVPPMLLYLQYPLGSVSDDNF